MNRSWMGLCVAATAALGGCAGSSLLSNGKVAEAGAATTGLVAPQPAPVTPEARAYQVGITSARAAKCGFNFDPAKLRAGYLASEQKAGATPESLPKIERVYDQSLAVMTKVVAKEADYCGDEKTKYIKADLTRHLAGDYSPGQPHPKKQEEEGLISLGGEGGLFGSGDASGGDEIMNKQRDALQY